MAWDKRQAVLSDLRVMALPPMPVRAADTGRFDLDQHAVLWASGPGDRLHFDRAAKRAVDSGTHGLPTLSSTI
eukprot:scaffold187789_cov32-Tisochrysis_lutea.AAC.2